MLPPAMPRFVGVPSAPGFGFPSEEDLCAREEVGGFKFSNAEYWVDGKHEYAVMSLLNHRSLVTSPLPPALTCSLTR